MKARYFFELYGAGAPTEAPTKTKPKVKPGVRPDKPRPATPHPNPFWDPRINPDTRPRPKACTRSRAARLLRDRL